MTTDQGGGLRIGEAAEQAGTTQRTLRYYEEIGLLPSASDREAGKHRLYTEEDITRVRDLLRLKDLLGLSLDELREVTEAEVARAELRAEYERVDNVAERRRVLGEILPYLEQQLKLVNRRRKELDDLHDDLRYRRDLITRKIADIDGGADA